MGKWWVIFIVAAIATVSVFGTGVAEAAKPKKDADTAKAADPKDDADTIQTIDNILSAAQADMARTASNFVDDAPSAGSQSEFDQMQTNAENRIGFTKGVADGLLRGIRDRADPGPVKDAANAALSDLSDSRDSAMAVVNSVEYSGGTTTTTAPTTTTTTTSPTTTTTTTSPTTTTTTIPGAPTTTTTTTRPQATTTTTIPGALTTTTSTVAGAPTTTTTTIAGAPTTTTIPGTTSSTTTSTTTTIPGTSTTTTLPAAAAPPGEGPGGGVAMPPPDPMSDVSPTASQAPSPMADMSGWLASMLDVALPPVVVAVVLSPLIVIEVVVRSVLRSGLAILPPILLLGAALLWLRWRDRRNDTAPGHVGDEPLATSS